MVKTLSKSINKGIIFNLSLFQFITFVRRGIFFTFMIPYLFNLLQIVTLTSALGTFNMIASALGQNLLWGKISDRYNLQAKLVIGGEFIAAITYAVIFLIHRYMLQAASDFTAGFSLILGFAFLEFFWSMSDVGWASLLSKVTTYGTRGKIIGLLNFLGSLGRMIGIFFAGFLYRGGEGFRQGTIFYLVIIMLFSTSIIMWLVSRYTHSPKNETEKESEERSSIVRYVNGGGITYKWFLISLSVIVIGLGCTYQIFPLFLQLPGGLNASDQELTLILSSWAFGGIFINLISGWLTDRIGRVKVLLFGLLFSSISPLFYFLAPNVILMALLYGLNGIGFWTIQTACFAFAGDIIPEKNRGKLFSKYNTVMALYWGSAGFFVGGPLADIQINALGTSSYVAYITTFFVSSIILFVGALLFVLKVVKKKKI